MELKQMEQQTEEQIYLKAFQEQEEREINLKCFFENLDIKPILEQEEQEDLNKNDFIVFCDNVVYNRNLTIIDSRQHTIEQHNRPFKAKGYLSKSEKSLLKRINQKKN